MSLTVLSNRYRVLNVLGDGGFGKTFLVEDTQMPSNRRCVLKQLKPVNDGTHELRQLVQNRFQREAATLEMLGEEHGQIPCLYAYFLEDEQFYLVQEWIDGVTIAEKVQREGPQSEQIVKTMIAQLLGAIAYIHSKGIVHRDIKPDNIILRRPDNQPVLIDFGAVKETMNTMVDSPGHSTRSIVVGTPGYMPTEQLAGRPVYASDIYSLGMTAVYMLTGKLPQEMLSDPASGELLWREHAPDISPAFATFLDTAIHTSTHSRFSTVQQMQTELQRLTLGADPTQVNPPVPTLYPVAEHSAPSVRPGVPVSASAPTLAHAPVSVQDGSGSYPPPTQSNSSPANSSPAPSSKNALIIGSLVGVSILLGAAMIGLNWSSVSEFPAEPLDIEPPLPESVLIPDPVIPDPVPVPVPVPEPVEPPPEPPIVVEPPVSGSPWAFMGTASSGESVSVNVNSIRVFADAVDFEYQIGDERILASADCFENRWFAEQYGWYSPQSDATQSMLDFVCQ